MSSKTDGNGTTTDFSYDGASRLIEKLYSSENSVSYTYDDAGNTISMTDSTGITIYSYDALNRLIQITDSYGKVLQYSYDPAGRTDTLTYPGSLAVDYDYDASGRLTYVTDWLGNQTEFTYDDAGRILSQANPNLTTVSYQYDAASQLLEIKNSKSDNEVISKHTFTLDKIGNRTNISETVPLSPNYTNGSINFNHNIGHQLISDDLRNYAYDGNGNRVEKDNGSATTNYAFNPGNRLTWISNGTDTYSYVYNGNDKLIASNSNGSFKQYVLDYSSGMASIIAQADDTGAIQKYYIYGNGGLLYSINAADNTTRQYHFDAVGSTMALTDASETITDKYAYSPYGMNLGESGSTDNPFRYVGKFGVMEENNGLLLMRARFYDPVTKRFLGKDPVKGNLDQSITMNPYLYSKASPVLLIDPSGNISEKAWLIGGGIVTMTAGVAMIVGGATASSTGVGAIGGVPAVMAGYTTFAVGATSLIAGLTFSIANVDDETAGQVYDGIQTAGDMASPGGMVAVGGAIATGHNSEEEVRKAAKIGGTANSIYSAGTGSVGDAILLMQNGIHTLDRGYDASIVYELNQAPVYRKGKI